MQLFDRRGCAGKGQAMAKGRVLITGVAGFLGSNLALRLLRDGWEVDGIDDMSQGFEQNLVHCRQQAKFTVVRGDVTDPAALAGAWRGADAIIHLAAFKIPRYSNALRTLQVNIHGSENVLKLAAEHKVKALLASTSDVYGKNPDLPFSEEHNLVMGSPKVARWSYAISKMVDEQLAFAYAAEYGMPVVLMRFFGSYGPHQNLTWWGGPQSVFIDLAMRGEAITLHGDGEQTRSFTYVDDTVDGIARCLENAAADNEVMNIGNNREITIRGLAEMIWGMVRPGEAAKLTLVPYEKFGRYEDVRRRVPDITKAQQLLGFTARVPLEEGLPRTIEWQRQAMRDGR